MNKANHYEAIYLNLEYIDKLESILCDIYDKGENNLNELSYKDLIEQLINNELYERNLTF